LPLPRTDSIHGTGVAGIAGGKGNNGITSVGVAWNARLMLIRVDTRRPGKKSFRDSVTHGIHYGLANEAQVINASLGSVFALRNSPSELTHESSCGLYVDNSVPSDKWDATVERVRNEWLDAMLDVDPFSAVITVPIPNCRVNMDQAGEIFTWPAVLSASRDDLGQPEPLVPTMIGVANAEIWQRLTNEERGFPVICSFDCGYGAQSAQITAPGRAWRLLSPRPDGVDGLYSGYSYCTDDEDYPRCDGASLAAPQVAATAAMVFSYSNEYALGLSPLEVKQRILDNASSHLSLDGYVEGSRFLDVHLAVTGGL
jgi:hypothetical protein